MYESFYGLAQPPFSLFPDPQFLYPSASHDQAIRDILQAIRRRERFIVLSGEVGTGKTTICRALLPRLGGTTRASLALNPFLSIEELLRQMLADFGAVSPDDAEGGGLAQATKSELTAALARGLDSLDPAEGRAVLILDEAQQLSPRVLEEIRLIAGIERGESPRLHVVLVGQPALLDMLAAADLRQLDQRISVKASLAPLDREDVEAYIAHRMTVAGESVSVAFERAAVARVHALSGGVPRVINLLCDRALMAGAAEGVYEITPDFVDQAAKAIAFRRPSHARRGAGRTRRIRWVAAAMGVLAVLLIGALQAPLHRLVETTRPALPPAPQATPSLDLPVVPAGVLPAAVATPPETRSASPAPA
jgi:general secretion pathway protein A